MTGYSLLECECGGTKFEVSLADDDTVIRARCLRCGTDFHYSRTPLTADIDPRRDVLTAFPKAVLTGGPHDGKIVGILPDVTRIIMAEEGSAGIIPAGDAAWVDEAAIGDPWGENPPPGHVYKYESARPDGTRIFRYER